MGLCIQPVQPSIVDTAPILVYIDRDGKVNGITGACPYIPQPGFVMVSIISTRISVVLSTFRQSEHADLKICVHVF